MQVFNQKHPHKDIQGLNSLVAEKKALGDWHAEKESILR